MIRRIIRKHESGSCSHKSLDFFENLAHVELCFADYLDRNVYYIFQ